MDRSEAGDSRLSLTPRAIGKDVFGACGLTITLAACQWLFSTKAAAGGVVLRAINAMEPLTFRAIFRQASDLADGELVRARIGSGGPRVA